MTNSEFYILEQRVLKLETPYFYDSDYYKNLSEQVCNIIDNSEYSICYENKNEYLKLKNKLISSKLDFDLKTQFKDITNFGVYNWDKNLLHMYVQPYIWNQNKLINELNEKINILTTKIEKFENKNIN